MKVMVIVKASEESERGVMPTSEELNAMGKFNEELVSAGIMLDGDGLRPSSKGVRINYSADGNTVTDGPFAETKELVAGYWVWQVKDMGEAIEWARRAPFQPDDAVEIRQFMQPEDFGDALTPEMRQQEEELRARSKNV